MKFLTLLSAAYIGGALRHPHEGAIHTEDAEADKLIADGVAVDVTDGFSAAQLKAATPETNTAPGGSVPTSAAENPHQAEIAPAIDDDNKPARRKAAADKE